VRLACILAGYLCGSIPFGLLLARRAGIDVRQAGSGNIGATNVARTAGARLGLATLVLDALKGALPTAAAAGLTGDTFTTAATGLAAFVGHVFPVTLGFAGGKGVATALGVLVVLCPWVALVAVALFAAVLALGRRVSAASIVGALVAPLAGALLGDPGPVVAATGAMAGIVVLRHRDNLRRLWDGTEPPLSLPKRQAPPSH
jgi:glycerol-3-phosphate acyltransferase PlsY